MRGLLKELRDEWFDRAFSKERPGAWTYKSSMQEAFNVVRETGDVSLRDARRAGARLEVVEGEVEVRARPADDEFGGGGLSPVASMMNKDGKLSKRKAVGMIDGMERKKAWGSIVEQHYWNNGLSHSTLFNQRKIDRVVSTYGNSPSLGGL